ncbi:bifunctional diaminohydroxyphosphoribosylaminopyrimidine deaminase/5-amino-6-(5-phosphoribosylamino)uracil reductase [Leptospira yasudae]|uniref:bifunctional diaminohydroxyphosphoribosylaminopyrimidine deaminase/5-amino-6-(5-phosphoribosylamino)uracil reductase RibD n=1 Tax=Leptospira yasudae TaxID=2202201 RepID=UPI0010835C01|nr:dihydrofolate reductase family protein [Leptospira yasudae]TGK24398.1 bifunctional diaminohydroxyphosphoribosylaminopyrimidine deaminase/5-amino-6-(5-phosphoribosylamino)uracil reductase [Leptospira yasudae]TGM05814.1 bifunctional diaminohydroxyphosphoribosylaminopyrimidine deaminase/5-amino-6-(5-phosphoribosylamino)uracil reductase [Leptospira yasudae]
MTFLPENIREEMRKLSFLSTGESSPNPPVSCIITDIENKKILAKGRTSPTGGPHAERNAYSEFVKNGLVGTAHNVWVTLEPCTHHGKTPPCLDLILEHKPKTLYYGWKDVNPLVRETDGLKKAAQAGISVVQDEDLAEIASESLFGFNSRIKYERPSLILKTAVSKEGYFAASDKSQIFLSGKLSLHLTSLLRAKCDAVLVGPGTLFYDKPGLDFRVLPAPAATEEFSDFAAERANGFANLLKNILLYGIKADVLKVHWDARAAYQPYRVFLIFEEKNVSTEWIEKQKNINERNESKKCIFLLKEGAILTEETKRALFSLTDHEIFTVSTNRLAEDCFSILSSIGVNLLLVEGGNLLYETFSAKMHENDLILKIQTSRSIQNGILPSLQTNAETLVWKTEVGEDSWEAHRCLRV